MRISYHTHNAQLINSVTKFIETWNNDELEFVTQTSGSTGVPKTIRILKKYARTSAMMTGRFLSLEQGNTALLCLSPETIAGKMMVIRAIVLELDLIVCDVVSNPLEGLNSHVDFAAMVPIQAQQSLQKLDTVDKLIIGGGTISIPLWEELECKKTNIYQTYGMTETISHIAMRKIGDSDIAYKALPGVQFTSKDKALTITALDLGIKELQTNDAVQLINEHSFNWLGRLDFVINSGGIKIHPEYIEDILSSCVPYPFFSAGLDDISLGQKQILCVESSDANSIDIKQIKAKLNKYLTPKEVHFFENFKYTVSGKIDRIETLKTIQNAQKQVL